MYKGSKHQRKKGDPLEAPFTPSDSDDECESDVNLSFRITYLAVNVTIEISRFSSNMVSRSLGVTEPLHQYSNITIPTFTVRRGP